MSQTDFQGPNLKTKNKRNKKECARLFTTDYMPFFKYIYIATA